MDMLLQFGHGMMGLTVDMLQNWSGGKVILSPRDLDPSQIVKFARKVLSLNGEILLDPQCYRRDADHHRLCQHEYYEIYRSINSSSLISGSGVAELLSTLSRFVTPLGIRRHILPGLLADPVTDDWFLLQERILEEAPSHFSDGDLLTTIALSSASMLDEAQVEAVIERASTWPLAGVYLVAESPSGYLVDNPGWLANLLILCSGLKLIGKKVIVGYCNHQSLCLAVANVDAISSGTWQNVRSFSPDKFYTPAPDEISRRTTWYYCPQVLSEFTMPFMDMAKRMNVLDQMRYHSPTGSNYTDILFSGLLPSTIGWGEREAFRHYLSCLHFQATTARKATYHETFDSYQQLLNIAESELRGLHQHGIYGQTRDFLPFFDINRSALIYLDQARGHQLRRNW